MTEQTSIQYLKGVGEKRAALLKRLGVATLGDLLRLYPRAYEDWSHPLPIAHALTGEPCCVKAIVGGEVKTHLVRQGMTLYKTQVTDGVSLLNITIFNNRYLAKQLQVGEEYLFYGKVTRDFSGYEMTAPAVESAEGGARLRAVYPQTEGMNSRTLGRLVETAFSLLPSEFPDCLPQALRERYCLMSPGDALRNIHAPQGFDYLSQAKRRLIFEELLILQLGLFRLKGRGRLLTGALPQRDASEAYLASLPFTPTNAQRRAVQEAIADMQSGRLMNRLLQGDVGSGKTAVAAALIDTMVQNGYQCALMAPTEVLARQHFTTLSGALQKSKVTAELLVGSVSAAQKKALKQRLESGETALVVGTHALIQADVRFARLGLVVTDEQHRFGVNQRAALSEKGDNPHLYVMSATPIPRTLALIIYGDLDVSVLDEMPPGRQQIETYAIGSDKRARAYGYVKKHLDRGLQGYVVCPAVEENELDLAAAAQYAENLAANEFKGYRVGLLHGKMKAAEKQAVMQAFHAGELQLLVSTTVIEVGVDVANAVIMVIENAERFGLSQLHQLRGRVGRGTEQSTCILISDAQNPEAVERLRTLCSTTDGFQIADADLKLRGPGDFFGARQHGLPTLKIADMMTDTQIIHETQQLAQELLARDALLESTENQGLAKAVDALFSQVSESGMN